ncbi:MAG: ATP-binding protein [Nitrospinae bacterium]|nr:ATP-binding protein [Nitrospinota bacterium]
MLQKDRQPRQIILNFPVRPEYAFSNFVVSQSSRFAFEAARDICSGKPVDYNALYISGDKGLGKTHLLLSIGNFVAGNFPGKSALYVQCGDFVGKIRENDDSAVAETLGKLADVDYFLMDDIDQISGQPEAQEKLYFIYNALMDKRKKIVFAGRRGPSQLAATESFLKSRFQWGLTAELKPIDETTLAEIMKKLGADLGLEIPAKISTYLLNRIPRDFHSIKNAVAAINRESLVQKKKVTVPLVKAALDLS